jgi:hypothetical protein
MLASIRNRCPWLPAALLLGAALAVLPAAFAATPSPAMPFKAKTAKIKNADWVGQWYQWAYNVPEPNCPWYDDTGAFAGVGQRGPVWFLCGAYTLSGTVTRTISVPEGVYLFFPLVEYQLDNADTAVPPYSLEQLYADCDSFIDLVDPLNLTCLVDTVPVTDLAKRRVVSTPFRYVAVPGSTPAIPVVDLGFGATAGDVVSPAVSNGYWVMLKPLPVGMHTIVWSSKIVFGGGDPDYVQNVTYVVHVEAPAN